MTTGSFTRNDNVMDWTSHQKIYNMKGTTDMSACVKF